MLVKITNSSMCFLNNIANCIICFVLFRSSDEVLHILGNILGSLQRGRTSLIVPRKKAIDDLIKSRNMVKIEIACDLQFFF